jgi:hypothetical protein
MTTELTAAAPRIAKSSPANSAGNAVIADVSGGTVVINKGSNDGLQVGMRMSIERIGKEVKDPATGQVLRRTTQRIGQVQLIDVDSRSSIGKILSGSKLAVGDLAKPLNNSAGN